MMMLFLCYVSQICPFTFRIQEQVLSQCTVSHDRNQTELGSSSQDTYPWACKNTGEWHAEHGIVSLQLFPLVWIFSRSLLVISHDRWVLNVGHKNYFKDYYLKDSQPTSPLLLCFNLMKCPYYQKDINQITINHTNI